MKGDFAISSLTAGQLNALVKNLMSQMNIDDPVEAVRRVNSGECVISQNRRIIDDGQIIDGDANPFIPEGKKVKQHLKIGQIRWNKEAQKGALFLSEGQKDNCYIKGSKIPWELPTMQILNANVLDYLLKNQHLIPEEWKEKKVCFWGTIYCSPDNDHYEYVRSLYWDDEEWHSTCTWLDFDFSNNSPAALLAS